MAGNISDYLENKLLDHSTGRAAYAAPTNTYVGLFLVAPTDSTAGTEVASANNYARQQITWGAAASGATSNSADIRFPANPAQNATGAWGTIVALGIFDTLSGGNLLWYGPISASVVVNSGDAFKITTGSLTLSLD